MMKALFKAEPSAPRLGKLLADCGGGGGGRMCTEGPLISPLFNKTNQLVFYK
jgi:hypothetical protein